MLESDLDLKLQSLTLEIPPEWNFRTIDATTAMSNSNIVWNNRVDIYPDRHVTQTWNVFRLIRILLNNQFLGVV